MKTKMHIPINTICWTIQGKMPQRLSSHDQSCVINVPNSQIILEQTEHITYHFTHQKFSIICF